MCMYLCIHVTAQQGNQESFMWNNDFLRRRMTWIGSWYYEKSIGKSSHEKYMRLLSYGYELILYVCIMLMFILWQVTLMDALAKWKYFGQRNVGTSMGKALETMFLGRENVLLDVRYYCCAYVVYIVHVASVMLCACSVAYI